MKTIMIMKFGNKVNCRKHILIVGGGFAGLNAAKILSGDKKKKITIIDRNNYHLFQPLLYQVAMAGLNPSDVAVPIRSIFSKSDNVRVYKGEVLYIDPGNKRVETDFGVQAYDYLVMACGARKFYFGNDQWETDAPALKSIGDAIDIRERILTAFERAEAIDDEMIRNNLLSFVIVGGGSTGVELAGALGEMCRYSMRRPGTRTDLSAGSKPPNFTCLPRNPGQPCRS
jgi:NADH:ubiquinone reductase (H+-translocating)